MGNPILDGRREMQKPILALIVLACFVLFFVLFTAWLDLKFIWLVIGMTICVFSASAVSAWISVASYVEREITTDVQLFIETVELSNGTTTQFFVDEDGSVKKLTEDHNKIFGKGWYIRKTKKQPWAYGVHFGSETKYEPVRNIPKN